MTNTWQDIKNANVIVVMGGNAAEAHPCGFKWVIEGKIENHAKLVVIDPRFTRTASVADVYAPIRPGSDIAFLSGVIRYLLENDAIQHEYVRAFTNASLIVKDGFSFENGLFDGYDHVYADVSCETSASGAPFRDQFASAVQRFANLHPRLEQRLMYGSDWDMLGYYEGFETFFDDWNAAFIEAAGAVGDPNLPSRFLNSNALDFLGLSADSPNQERILAFYGGKNNAPDWLTKP